MKNKQIRINFIKGENTEEIKLSNSVLFRLYARYKNIEIKDGIKIDNIIKYFLPSNYDKAIKCLEQGIDFKGKHYIPLITNPGMMKQEDNRFKAQYLFIAEEDAKFVDLYSELITLGLDKKLKQDKIVINKDVIARYGLGLSSAFKVDCNLRIVILPSDSYTHIANYVTVENGELKELDNQSKEMEFADGCGFMSNKLSKIIQEQLNLDYNIDWIGIRMYNGLATKGLVVRADWNRYFNNNYKKTDYFERREDGYYVKDYFGKWVNISEADLILNTNMSKYAKLWKDENFEDINDAINDALDKYADYKDILSAVYVCKLPKKNLETYRPISYQVLNNLALLPNELEKLQADTEKYLEKIVLDKDEDSIKLFMNDIALEDSTELNASTKVHRLMQLEDYNFIKTKTANNIIHDMVYNKCHELVCRPYVKGNFKTAFIDPICYLEWIITRDIELSRELGVGEFYVPREAGNRVITRNPLAVFSEIHRVNLVSTSKLEEYFGDLTSELIFFNMVDNTSFVSSGSDFDLDMFGVWDNEIIYNAVIEPKDDRHFFNVDDGRKGAEMEFNTHNLYESVLKGSGNLIGKIANATTKISNICNTIGYRFNDTDVSYIELRNAWLEHDAKDIKDRLDKEFKNLEIAKEDKRSGNYVNDIDAEIKCYREKIDLLKEERNIKFNAWLESKIEDGVIENLINADDETIRQSIINAHYKMRKYSYDALRLSQIAIDAPKCLYLPSADDLESIQKFIDMSQPRFVYYSKFTKNKEAVVVKYEDTIYTRSSLNINADRIYRKLIKGMWSKSSNDNAWSYKELLGEFATDNDEAKSKVKEIYDYYNKATEVIRVADKSAEEKKLAYNRRDLEICNLVIELESKFEANDVVGAIINMSTKFITNYFWNTVENILALKDRNASIYIEDESGEYNWMFKNYRKEKATLKQGKLQVRFIKDLEDKVTHKLNIGGYEGARIKDTLINVKIETYKNKENLVIYNSDDEKVGFVYPSTAMLKDGRRIKERLLEVLKVEVKKTKADKEFLEITIAV